MSLGDSRYRGDSTSPGAAKALGQHLAAVVEDRAHPRRNDARVHEVADRTERHGVVHDVPHPRALGDRLEVVLVVPEGVRAHALLIDEPHEGFDVLDLGHPGHRNVDQCITEAPSPLPQGRRTHKPSVAGSNPAPATILT